MEEVDVREARMVKAYFQAEYLGIYQYKSHSYKWRIRSENITLFSPENKAFGFVFSEMPVRLNRQTKCYARKKTVLMYFSGLLLFPLEVPAMKNEKMIRIILLQHVIRTSFVSPNAALVFTQQG